MSGGRLIRMSRARLSAVSMLAALAVLAGCETPGSDDAAPSGAASGSDAGETQAAAGMPDSEVDGLALTLPPRMVRPPVEPVEFAVPVRINDDPEQVMGLAGAELEDLLGRPGLLRDEPPAQVWQYGHDDCVLDVFLYSEAFDTVAVYRVLYYELREAAGDDDSRRRCFRKFLEQRGEG